MLKTIRQTFVGAIGTKATHALEAGVVLSVLVTSAHYFPEYSLALASLFGVEKAYKKIKNKNKTLPEVELYDLLVAITPKQHMKDIRVQPIYLIAGSAIGSTGVYTAAVLTGRTVLFLPV